MKRPLMCSGDLLDRDLSGHTYIVTGGNSGIGLVTVQQLAKQGAAVVLACRRPAEGEKVAQEVRTHGVSGQIVVMALDLSSLESVRDFARDFLAAFSQLNGLVNNAGVMNTPYGRTVDGFEMQFGVNHLGHYLLTELLLDRIRHTAPSRIVCVSSAYHDKAFGREGRIDFDDLHFERRRYDGWEAYAQSKLANVLHARALARRLEGSGVTAVSLHPGWVRTNLIRTTLPVWVQDVLLGPVLKLGGMIEPWEGAQTTLHCLLSPEVVQHPGAFFSQTGVYRKRQLNRGGWPLESPNPNALDDALAAALDGCSRQLVGLSVG
jgi:NAD(P)-dependent dehydrogenase (short-subunit alcohol dehydrogenase family)